MDRLGPYPARHGTVREAVAVPRPTSAQIDDDILETAAGLIASRGVVHTSLGQIATAVGYSKTGLLHRFATKQALVDAVLDRALSRLETICADVAHLPRGPRRDAAVVTALAVFAVEAPGQVGLVLSAFTATPAATDREPVLDRLAAALCTAFDDGPAVGVEREWRAAGALAALAVLAPGAAAHAVDAGVRAAVDLLVTIALDALGVATEDR